MFISKSKCNGCIDHIMSFWFTFRDTFERPVYNTFCAVFRAGKLQHETYEHIIISKPVSNFRHMHQ